MKNSSSRSQVLLMVMNEMLLFALQAHITIVLGERGSGQTENLGVFTGQPWQWGIGALAIVIAAAVAAAAVAVAVRLLLVIAVALRLLLCLLLWGRGGGSHGQPASTKRQVAFASQPCATQ